MAKRKGKPDSFRGPLPLDRKRLWRLPQTFDVWQVDARPVAATVRAEGRAIQPWMILVVSRTAGHILAFELAQKSRQTLKEQYERAIRDNQAVVFVRDNEQRRLVSFSMDLQ